MAFPPPPWPSRLIDQNFGMCITPNDIILPFYNTYSNYYRPWKWGMQSIQDFGSTINNENESFKVTLDVQHFRPDELSVKVANNQILIEGKHEERKDEHGFVSRQFTRRYALPNNCMPEDVISNLSSDGVLTVEASKKTLLPKNENIVPIKLWKSCPLKEEAKTVINTEQKDKSAAMEMADTCKKNTQIMLKEDHCCLLLKPELLREAVSETTDIIVEKKQGHVEKEKLKACPADKNTSEILEQTFAKSSATSTTGEKCDKAAMSKSEVSEQKKAQSSATKAASDEKMYKESGAMSKSEEIPKSSEATSASEEKLDHFDKAGTSMSTLEKSEKTFDKSSAAKSTSQKAGQSRMTKSEMSELTSISSKTSESIDCSTSYKASITSNIKEISENLSDFVSDILCSELDKTLDIKKKKNCLGLVSCYKKFIALVISYA